ncbi:hypothetical protein EW053_20160 [Streptomyces sp. IB2014 016-6]|nr:hypothetical protein EW053_20160 [Streptomyces sp. IB2014 016-6]
MRDHDRTDACFPGIPDLVEALALKARRPDRVALKGAGGGATRTGANFTSSTSRTNEAPRAGGTGNGDHHRRAVTNCHLPAGHPD